jgi:exopolysaccharide biosynthesis polyprenyl glycosylphosphotransferase
VEERHDGRENGHGSPVFAITAPPRPGSTATPLGLLPATAGEIESLLDQRTLMLVAGRHSSEPIRRRGWLVRRMLLAADLVGLMIAFTLAEFIVGPDRANDHLGRVYEYLAFFASLPVWVLVAKLHGLYDRDEERTDHSTVDDLKGVLHLVTIGTWLVFAGAWLTGVAEPDLPKIFFFWLSAIVVVAVARSSARAVCRHQLAYLQNTIIVGAGEVGQLIARKLLHHPEYGINLVGFVDEYPKERHEGLDDLTVLGSSSDLSDLIEMLDIERVIVAFSNDSHEKTLALIRSLKDFDIQIDVVPRLFEVVGANVGIHSVEGLPLVGLPPLRLSRSSRLLKRLLDLTLAGVGLVLLTPLFAVVALLIKLESRGPIFFRQERVGVGGATFRIFKLRTMVVDADERKVEFAHLNIHARPGGDSRMFKIPLDPRVTRVGNVLRRFSLDELPQLINVARGEMSLVGPRPLIADEDRWVVEWARRRLDLKPGITGLWQVLGASDIPFDEMTKLDYLYVTNWSLSRDLGLILKTIPTILRQRSIY